MKEPELNPKFATLSDDDLAQRIKYATRYNRNCEEYKEEYARRSAQWRTEGAIMYTFPLGFIFVWFPVLMFLAVRMHPLGHNASILAASLLSLVGSLLTTAYVVTPLLYDRVYACEYRGYKKSIEHYCADLGGVPLGRR